MNPKYGTILAFVFILLAGCSSLDKKQDLAIYLGGFNGVWEGEFEPVIQSTYPFNSSGGESAFLRITVKGDIVNISTLSKEKWVSIKPGSFKIKQHKTNAIIYSIDSAKDVLDQSGYGGWVETWNISLTHKEANSLYATLTRVVNNYLLPAEKKKAKTQGRYIGSFRGTLNKS